MGNDQRAIVGFMGAAVVFALIGDVVKQKTKSVPAGSYVKILLGGGLATGLLVLMSEAGATGADFAKGLAVITLVASVLSNGTVVFTGIDKLTTSVNGLGTTTTATAKSTPQGSKG
jgi:hypothetical protein